MTHAEFDQLGFLTKVFVLITEAKGLISDEDFKYMLDSIRGE